MDLVSRAIEAEGVGGWTMSSPRKKVRGRGEGKIDVFLVVLTGKTLGFVALT